MTTQKSVFTLAIAALLVATPAMGQLANFPVGALAEGDADGVTSVAGGFARGLNENSTKQSAFALGIVRSMEKVSFGIAGGYVASDTDELGLAGVVGVHLLSDAPVQLTLQSGLGWIKQDVGALSLTSLHIPFGVAIQSAGDGNVKPWVMPRVSMIRSSGSAVTVTNTDTKFGVSAGVSVATEGGVGFGLAVDLQRFDAGTADESSVAFSFGISYILGS